MKNLIIGWTQVLSCNKIQKCNAKCRRMWMLNEDNAIIYIHAPMVSTEAVSRVSASSSFLDVFIWTPMAHITPVKSPG